MENIFDIKRKKSLNFILPLNYELSVEQIDFGQILIIIYLFYDSTLESYFKYINNIPSNIDILFVTSNKEVIIRLKRSDVLQGKNYKIIEKENRGRDISGLLVACRKEVLKYKYVCFLHDKMWKDKIKKRDTELFIKCLWENMVGSEIYISNLIKIMDKNDNIGILFPPEFMGDEFPFLYQNTWYKDFELMQELAAKISLNCNLDKNKKPISVGTAFWAKVDALKKLFHIEWKYEDFNEEPLKDDATISHAIERCFGYVAQDAGYDAGIVMTDQYAGKQFDYFQDILTIAFEQMEEILSISKIYELKNNKLLYKDILEFVARYYPVYIYGAGKSAQRCIKLLHAASYRIEACVVSTNESRKTELEGIPIILFSELKLGDTSGIIIAVRDKIVQEEMEKKIKEKYPWFKQIFYFG